MFLPTVIKVNYLTKNSTWQVAEHRRRITVNEKTVPTTKIPIWSKICMEKEGHRLGFVSKSRTL